MKNILGFLHRQQEAQRQESLNIKRNIETGSRLVTEPTWDLQSLL